MRNMFGAQKKTTCCGHKKKLSMFDDEVLETEDDHYHFDDLPCNVKHLLDELGQKNEINIELLLIKINNHIRQSDSFQKKKCDPTKF